MTRDRVHYIEVHQPGLFLEQRCFALPDRNEVGQVFLILLLSLFPGEAGKMLLYTVRQVIHMTSIHCFSELCGKNGCLWKTGLCSVSQLHYQYEGDYYGREL